MVQFAETKIAALTLAAASLSLICCSVIALSIRLDPRGSKSYHLILVQSLLRADIGLSLSIVIYFSVQYYISGDSLETFCSGFLPFLVYFFLTSSGWTVMLALRFRSSQNVAAQFNKPPVPLWAVWVVPLIPAIVMMTTSVSLPGVTDARTNSSDTNQSCQFNHSTASGILVDILCFQAPLIAIMFVNLYTYARGLAALNNAPHSVIARQMRRAGGYIAVLLVVWVPNIAYNLLVICDDSNEPYDNFLVLTVMLSASQGFLNTCVYVYSNRTMLKWLQNNCFCLRLTGRGPRMSVNHNTRSSIDKNVENGFEGETKPGQESTTDSELDELEDDTQWLAAQSFSVPRKLREASNSRDLSTDNEAGQQQVINVLVEGTGELNSAGTLSDLTTQNNSSSTNSNLSRKSLASLHSVKSILIGEKNSKNIDVKSKRFSGFFPDLDSEKFVRFGQTETRMISEARSSSNRDSEIELS